MPRDNKQNRGDDDMDKEQAIEMAVYDIYAHSDNVNDVPQMKLDHITDENNLNNNFLPKGMRETPALISKLNDILSSTPVMNSANAARQYILSAKKLRGFDESIYEGQIIEKEKDKETEKDIQIIINSAQATIKYKETRTSVPFALKHVRTIERIDQTIRINTADDEGVTTSFTLRIEHADEIESMIKQELKYIIPLTKSRQNLMCNCYYITPQPATGALPYFVATRFNERKPRLVYLNPNSTRDELFSELRKHLFISEAVLNKYSLVYLLGNDLLEMPEKGKFANLGIQPNTTFYFLVKDTPLYLETSQGFITCHKVDITQPVSQICSNVVQELGLGSDEGYTLYTTDSAEVPFDIELSIPFQTTQIWDHILKRRFYVFSEDFLDQEINIIALYNDCRQAVLSEHIQVSEDQAILLAIFSIYAQIPTVTDFLSMLNRTDISDLLPPKYVNSASAIRKLQASTKSSKPLSNHGARAHYIAEVCTLPGFATEFHRIEYQIPGKDMRNGSILLSPLYIAV